jgi:hypothetical protein
MGAFIRRLSSDRFQLAGDVIAAALAAKIAIFLLRGRDKPKAAARLAEDC